MTGVTVYAARADFGGVFAVGHPYRHRRHRCLTVFGRGLSNRYANTVNQLPFP
jgi:hypothetical protein